MPPKRNRKGSRVARRSGTKTQKAILARRAAYRETVVRRRDKSRGA